MTADPNAEGILGHSVKKALTGIKGLDEITGGGLPQNRPTLVCGGPGCGKTLLSMEFIVNGITHFGENGVYITFDESLKDLMENVASIGFDIKGMIEQHSLAVTEIVLPSQNVVEAGDYDLNGLFARIGYAIDTVKAKRVVIDGIETIFSFFSNDSVIRLELKRLFRWLKEKEVTSIITCERGEGERLVSRHGIEEYVSDCVILLDQRIKEQSAIRRLHILKYRGSLHGSNEYPFLVTDKGISILPITSMQLNYAVSNERISSGVPGVDMMLTGKGYFKGSTILISGTAGTGKSSLAAHFAASVCDSGQRCIYFAFEESADQIIRNMRSIGLDLSPHVEQGLLKFHAMRPTQYGIEMHLLIMQNLIMSFQPSAVVIDPISNLISVAVIADIKLMFMRLLDTLKTSGITTLSTNLTSGGKYFESTEIGLSSAMDTWIVMKNREKKHRRERCIEIIKSRGMAHTSKIHTFEITGTGIELSRVQDDKLTIQEIEP
jgi:circadian clock protein KaiC